MAGNPTDGYGVFTPLFTAAKNISVFIKKL
jgi:hypothetical protein